MGQRTQQENFRDDLLDGPGDEEVGNSRARDNSKGHRGPCLCALVTCMASQHSPVHLLTVPPPYFPSFCRQFWPRTGHRQVGKEGSRYGRFSCELARPKLGVTCHCRCPLHACLEGRSSPTDLLDFVPSCPVPRLTSPQPISDHAGGAPTEACTHRLLTNSRTNHRMVRGLSHVHCDVRIDRAEGGTSHPSRATGAAHQRDSVWPLPPR